MRSGTGPSVVASRTPIDHHPPAAEGSLYRGAPTAITIGHHDAAYAAEADLRLPHARPVRVVTRPRIQPLR